MKRINKVWKEHEKYQLLVAYRLKAPLCVMEACFKRTLTSINKYLARSGIRGYCAEKNTTPIQNNPIRTVDDLDKVIISLGLDNHTVGLERQSTRHWKPSASTVEKLQYLGLDTDTPWAPKKKNTNLPIKSGIGRTSKKMPWVYVSMATVENYLRQNGETVTLFLKKNPYGWTYMLNQRPISTSFLLGHANILRRQKKQPRFLVEGITYE
ncbi:MAG: hypothetical protein KBB83_03355 [Alphaproteobacteria bacterium]|nr:hypothetical protein [Alphaproteobacteria bacterium]